MRRMNSESSTGGQSEAIKVCVRVRPFNKREKDLKSQLCVHISESSKDTVVVTSPKASSASGQPREANDQKKSYTFDRAYWSHQPADSHFASQQTVMDEIGEDLVKSTLDGYNGWFFCYGQTGSGKTFSLLGNKDDPSLRGLLPRVAERMFEVIGDLVADGRNTVTCNVNYVEIYNEQINDLLHKRTSNAPHILPPKLEVRCHPKMGVYIQNVTDCNVVDRASVMEALERGMQLRAVSSTSMNSESSRSHCIFTMEIRQLVVQEDGVKKSIRSKVNFVDLAGSERSKKAGTSGDALKEGVSINQSLSNLAVVIHRLAEQATEAFMHEMERWSIDLQRHCPSDWNQFSAVLLRCLSGDTEGKDGRGDAFTI